MTEQEFSSVGYVVVCMYGRVHEDLSGPKVVLHPGGTFFFFVGPARQNLHPSSLLIQKKFDLIQEG